MQPSVDPESSGTERLQSELGRLFAHLGRAIRPAPGGLGRGEYLVLSGLDRHGPRRGRELALGEGLDASTVSRRLAHMEGRGLVERVPDPADGRASLVRVTEAGRQAHAAERRRRVELVTDHVGAWDAADVTRLADLVSRLNSAFEGTEDPHV